MKDKYVKLKLILLVSILIVFGISQVAMASKSVTYDTVVVVLDTPDTAISDAIHTLQKELSNPKIVSFNSFEYLWASAFHPTNNYVLVGHANNEGISVNGQITTWEDFSNVINHLYPRNKVNFIACNSANIANEVKSDKIGLTFKNTIDATFGALFYSLTEKIRDIKFVGLTAMMQTPVISNLYSKLVNRFIEISTHPQLAHNLILGPQEAIINYALFAVNLIATIAFAASAVHGLQHGAEAFFAHNPELFVGLIEAVHMTIVTYEWAEAAEGLVDAWLSFDAHNILDYIQNEMTVADWLIFIGFIGFFVALSYASMGTAMVANILILTGSWINWANTYSTDKSDPDNAYGVTDGTVYYPPSTGGGGGGSGGTCGDTFYPNHLLCP